METSITETAKQNWFDKRYKLLMLIPIILVVISLVYLGYFYKQHNSFILKDVSLSGGTTITLTGDYDLIKLETSLKSKFPDISIRQLAELSTGRQIALVVESSSSPEELKSGIEDIFGKIPAENIAIEFSGSTLSESFFKQLILALIISFMLMSIVIFILFRTFIPSMAVMFAAFSDIIIPLAIIDYFGIRLSAAGIAAFLMLIGYSVDTDILLTTRAIKKTEGKVNARIYSAFKTGIFMTLSALAATLPALFLITGLPDSFRQIFLVLALGLTADIFNTWLTNTGIIKWYCVKKGIN
ncbi:MAG: protein translocase subunit SecF [Nanoarchaeota archaeon]